MKVAGETSAWDNLVLLSIGTDLVGIHANHGDLNRAGKVEIIVTQVIGRCFKLFLIHGSCVIN